jgi:hypothetical protein
MKKERNSEESITLTSPVSIIRNSLKRREAAIRLQNERLPEATAVVEALKAERYPDPGSIKAAQERVRLWVRERRWFSMLTDLTDKIEANPYPGQYYRLLELASLLVPNVSNQEWREIFYWFRIDNVVVHLPVEIVDIDIVSVERQLLELITEDNVIPASSLEKVLQSSPNSKQYRTTKTHLQQRGWHWVRKRTDATTVCIIEPPYCHTQ